MSTNELLISALNALPLPGAPPRISRTGASIGLAFLETALRQNHVRRMTEQLTFEEHLAASRTVVLDIGLGLLDDLQVEAGERYSRIRDRRPDRGVDGEDRPASPVTASPLIWVAIGRHSRTSVYPVEVVDASGVAVPRLTQYETSRLIAAGMYRLLRHILESDPNAGKDGDLKQLLFENSQARWLLQSAILTLFDERSLPIPDDEPTIRATGSGTRTHRDLVRRVLDDRAQLLSGYMQLLRLAVTEYLVVVGLPTDKQEHHLSYSAPLVSSRPDLRQRLTTFVRHVNPWSYGYRVLYTTDIPANLRSYHVMATTPAGVQVQRLTLECDSDRVRAAAALRDLATLAALDGAGGEARRLRQLEVESAAATLSQVSRRRRWDRAAGRPTSRSVSALGNWSRGAVESYLSPVLGPGADLPLDPGEAVRHATLDDLGRDFYEGVRPTASTAHAYWRRNAEVEVETRPLRAHCTLLFGSSGPVNVRSISMFSLLAFVVLVCLGAMTFESFAIWTWGDGDDRLPRPEAMITVVLLVPGFLYTRLDTPRASEVSARLQLLPRVASYVSIGATAAVAGYIATDPPLDGWARVLWYALAVEAFGLVCLLVRAGRTYWGLQAPHPTDTRKYAFDAVFHGHMGARVRANDGSMGH